MGLGSAAGAREGAAQLRQVLRRRAQAGHRAESRRCGCVGGGVSRRLRLGAKSGREPDVCWGNNSSGQLNMPPGLTGSTLEPTTRAPSLTQA